MGAAYLILALYWTHQMDSTKIARYMGLAHQSKEIICPPSPGLVASLTFVSVFLYDAKVRVSYGDRNWEIPWATVHGSQSDDYKCVSLFFVTLKRHVGCGIFFGCFFP